MTIRTAGELMAAASVATIHPQPMTKHSPQRPDTSVLDLLHRKHDGTVCFTRQGPRGWEELGSFPASMLSGLFADNAIAEVMDGDAYFSVNGMYSPRVQARTSQHQLPGFGRPVRKDGLRWITACYVDLDAYKVGLDAHGAIAAVGRLVDAGVVPMPSVYTFSQGAWAFWLLCDREDRRSPLRANNPAVVERWAKIQSLIHQACAAIGSDPRSRDAARVTRIPGTLSTRTRSRVSYYRTGTLRDGDTPAYTLDDLEAALAPLAQRLKPVRVVDAKPFRERLPDSKRGSLGKPGAVERYATMLERLRVLRDQRGGWRVGHRNAAIFYVCVAATRLRMTDEQTHDELEEHLRWMDQPYRDAVTFKDAEAVLRSVRDGQGGKWGIVGHPRNQKVADDLAVTPEEAAFLSVVGGGMKREPFPAAAIHPPVERLTRRDETARNREVARTLVEAAAEKGVRMSGTDLQRAMSEGGIGVSRKTANAYLRECGSPSRLARRKPAPDSNGRLF
jgi:hypothetical protein